MQQRRGLGLIFLCAYLAAGHAPLPSHSAHIWHHPVLITAALRPTLNRVQISTDMLKKGTQLEKIWTFTGKNKNILNLLTRCWYFAFIVLLQEWKCGFSPLILSCLLKFIMLTLYNTAKKNVMLILFLDCSALGINISLCSPVQVFRERFPIRVMSPLCMATMQQFMGRLQILIKFLQP